MKHDILHTMFTSTSVDGRITFRIRKFKVNTRRPQGFQRWRLVYCPSWR